MEDPRLEKLRLRLTGTRQKAPGTIANYLQTSTRFLSGLSKEEFGSTDVDLYIAKRRVDGIGERSLRTEFYALKRLCLANNVDWPFTKDDRPTSTTQPAKTFFKPAQVEQLIMAQGEYAKADRFYLAVATTWACRREAMSQIQKRDFDQDTFLIRGVHLSQPVRHLIPEVIKPIIAQWPGEHSTSALSKMFGRICLKAKLDVPDGYGWHTIRRTLTSIMANLLPRNGMAPSLWAEYTGWSKQAKGRYFMDSAMMGEYSNTAEVNDDPYVVDRQVYSVHPFLKTWAAALAFSGPEPPKALEVPTTDPPEIMPANMPEQAPTEEPSPLDIRVLALRKIFGGL